MDGKMEAGKKAYLITHAYYHVVCEIVEMLGPQRAIVANVRLVISSQKSWEDFFSPPDSVRLPNPIGCRRANYPGSTLSSGSMKSHDTERQ